MQVKMREKATVFLFIFFFAAAFFSTTTSAVPSTRSLNSLTHGYKSKQHHLYHQIFQMKEGRIDAEVTDYSGTGANNHHDPKPPPGTF